MTRETHTACSSDARKRLAEAAAQVGEVLQPIADTYVDACRKLNETIATGSAVGQVVSDLRKRAEHVEARVTELEAQVESLTAPYRVDASASGGMLHKYPEDRQPAQPEPEPVDNGVGLEARYEVKKLNDPTGKHDRCGYFVLDPQHDETAAEALRYYASRTPHIALRRDLNGWLDSLVDPPDPVDGEPAPDIKAKAWERFAARVDDVGWTDASNVAEFNYAVHKAFQALRDYLRAATR